MTVQACVQDCGYSLGDVAVLLMPYPICRLLEARQIHHVLVLVRWHMHLRCDRSKAKTRCPGVLPGFPPETSAAWTLCGKDEDCELSIDAQNRRFDYANVKHLQRTFLALLPIVLRASGPNLESNTAAITEVVQMLENWKQALDSNTCLCGMKQGKFRHDSRVLLECIRLTKHLSGGSDSL